MSTILSGDYNVLTADNGQEALELMAKKAAEETIHLIISDQRMPTLSGLELMKKSISLLPNSIRIISTGFTDFDNITTALRQGQIHQFIIKFIQALIYSLSSYSNHSVFNDCMNQS